MAGLGVTCFQVFLLVCISLAMGATLPNQDHEKKGSEEGVVTAETSALDQHEGVVVIPNNKPVVVSAPHFPPVGLSRAKRYIGWGRRPGMRYSKATWDWDNNFNDKFNKHDKRVQTSQDTPVVSNFRELRMKQKVPNAQLLLPHLFNRNNRLSSNDGDNNNQDVVELTEEDVEALLYLLEDYYAKNGRPANNNEGQ